jgi:O-antigen ligase
VSPYPLLAALGLVWTWWGWKTGAYFGDVLIPGGMLLALVLASLAILAPWPARLRGPALLALVSLAGLAAWTLVSFLWTPAQEVALADAERVTVYAIAFVLGVWLCLLLEREMTLSMLPVAVAGAAVALATTAMIAVGDEPARYLDLEGLLSYPLGYHNAVAAFMFICALPTIVLAVNSRLPWGARAAFASAVTLELGLLVLTQSRGAAFAAIVGLAVLVFLSESRLGTVGWTVISAAPVVLILPLLLGVYSAAGDGPEAAGGELNAAGGALLVAALASAALGAVVARSSDRFVLPSATRRRVGVGVAVLVALAAIVPLGVVVARDGGPGAFLDNRISELSAGNPDFQESGSRLGVNLGTDRGTLWGVALDDVAGAPLGGVGAGGFEYSYLESRESPDELTSEDPHGTWALMLSELGVIGFGLFAAFVIGAVLACLRSRKLGPAAQALGAGALASFAYWMVHASVDWFWHYPAVTGPVVMLLGAAAAPHLRVLENLRLPLRRAVAVAAAMVALVVIQAPLFLSERLLRDGIATGSDDVSSAYSDLGLAADLNPWSPAPLIAEAEIAEEAGESQRALALLARASERKPQDWTPHFLAARVLAESDPELAAGELEEARRLNPQGSRIIEAQAELEGQTAP